VRDWLVLARPTKSWPSRRYLYLQARGGSGTCAPAQVLDESSTGGITYPLPGRPRIFSRPRKRVYTLTPVRPTLPREARGTGRPGPKPTTRSQFMTPRPRQPRRVVEIYYRRRLPGEIPDPVAGAATLQVLATARRSWQEPRRARPTIGWSWTAVIRALEAFEASCSGPRFYNRFRICPARGIQGVGLPGGRPAAGSRARPQARQRNQDSVATAR